MTWYANRIYVNASPSVIEALREDPIFEGHLFLLRGELPASWEDGSAQLRLPGDGLVVVKEIGPGEYAGEAEIALASIFGEHIPRVRKSHDWYADGEWLSWNRVQGPSDVEVLDPAGIDELAECDVPPLAFLRFLADLHARCGQPVSYYLGRTWGGELEGEAAWVFAEREVLYCLRVPHDDEVVVFDHEGRRRVVRDDLLRLALTHHGVHLPGAWFAPHTRRFDWESRRL